MRSGHVAGRVGWKRGFVHLVEVDRARPRLVTALKSFEAAKELDNVVACSRTKAGLFRSLKKNPLGVLFDETVHLLCRCVMALPHVLRVQVGKRPVALLAFRGVGRLQRVNKLLRSGSASEVVHDAQERGLRFNLQPRVDRRLVLTFRRTCRCSIRCRGFEQRLKSLLERGKLHSHRLGHVRAELRVARVLLAHELHHLECLLLRHAALGLNHGVGSRASIARRRVRRSRCRVCGRCVFCGRRYRGVFSGRRCRGCGRVVLLRLVLGYTRRRVPFMWSTMSASRRWRWRRTMSASRRRRWRQAQAPGFRS
mmetsp:Transcript_44005/g.135842  ORF Transcript_44005/g.135842 Transcript_44005/m.135842 type:complete len:310 (-) Transcript_44005:297-1226(-)